MKLLIFGDIYGRNGRRLINKYLPSLKSKYSPDFIIGNSENLTSGKGPNLKHIQYMQELGFDCLTGGDHIFSNLNYIKDYLNTGNCIQIRPANFYENINYTIPGKGFKIIEKDGFKILIINLIGDAFIATKVYNPFLKIDEILNNYSNENFDAIIVDFHRETTAEMYAMSEFLNGKISLIYGTHTHVQTNDEHILNGGTGMICDVGMTGALRSSIGQTFDTRLPKFITGLNIFSEKPVQDLGAGVLNGIYVEIQNKKCISIEKIRILE